MQGRLFIVSICLVLAGCHSIKMQQPDASQKTHNICYELKQQMLQNQLQSQPEAQGNSPIESAKLHQLYRKYNCQTNEASGTSSMP